MVDRSRRDVTLGIGIETSGEDGLQDLAARLKGLGVAAGQSTPELDRLAAELGQLTAATEEKRRAEASARADATAARAALDAQRDALARLRAESDRATRGTVEYQQAERSLRLAVVDARTALRERQAALASSAAETRAAVSAEARLAEQIKSTAAASAAAARAQTQGNASVAASVAQLRDQLAALRNLAGAALGGSLVGSLARDIGQTADAYNNLAARIRLATGEGAAFESAFSAVQDIAQRTGTSLEQTGTLFARITQAGKEFGLAQADALALTEAIGQAAAISGATAQSADAALTQLIQGLQSGVLRGEEFNSVLEQAPRLARALADGLGVTTGELRKLAEAGTLTSDVVIRALQGQAQTLRQEFESLPPTVGRALGSLSNAWTVYVGEVDKATGASATAARSIESLARNLDTVGAVLFGVGKAVAAYQALRLAQSFLESAAAARATATATAAATAATVAHTAATAANTAAQTANAAASAGSVATAGRLAGVLSTLKTFSLIGVLTNIREIGTAIGAGVAKLQGYGKAFEEAEIRAKADAETTRQNAAAKAALAQATALATDKALGLNAESKRLIAEFEGVSAKTGDTREAVEKLAKSLRLDDLSGISAAGAALDALGVRGKLTAEQIRAAFAAALDGKDLAVFETQARAAFDNTEQGARRLAAAIDAVNSEALRRAGTSAQELASGFSAAANSAINDVDTLARALKSLGATGDDAGRALTAALDKALAAAGTERAVQAVIDRFKALGEQGLLTGDQVAEGLEKARRKIDDLKPGINSLSEALRSFGLKTREELQATADKLAASYRAISQSLTVSIADKIKAFQQYRDAAVAANGGVESSEVKLQRSILETQAKAAGFGDVFEDAMQRGERATRRATEAIQSQIASLSSLTDAARKAQGSLSTLGSNTYDKDGFATDSNGNRINITGQLNIPEGGYFDEQAFLRAQYSAALSGLAAPNPQNFVVTSPGSIRRSGAPVEGIGYAKASPTTVNINVNGQKAGTVNVASAQDVSELENVVRQLSLSQRSTGQGAGGY